MALNNYTETPTDTRAYDANGTFDTDLALQHDHKVGFGDGSQGDYKFADVNFSNPTNSPPLTQVEFSYDALGRRIQKVSGGSTTNYYYSGPHVIEERDGSDNVTATYVYGSGIDEIISMTRGSTAYYYHTDDLGNVMAITDDSGSVVERYDYADYGAVSYFDGSDNPISATAIGNPLLFNGRRYDEETDLYVYRTRYMDPSAGRFISRDTIGQWGDPNNLGNGQAYVGHNPWTYVDPYGQDAWTRIFGGLKFVGGFAEAGVGVVLLTGGGISEGATLGASTPVSVPVMVVGGMLLVHGSDTLASGWRELYTGETHQTITQRTITRATGSRQLGIAVDTALGMAGGGTGFVRSASGRLARPASTLSRGVSSTVEEVWNLGPFRRGELIEQALGQNLPKKFKTWDRFVNGVATSLKSLNLDDKTYQKAGGIWRAGKRYVDAAIDFDKFQMNNIVIGSEDIVERVVTIAIPRAPGVGQLEEMRRVYQYGVDNGIQVIWQIFE